MKIFEELITSARWVVAVMASGFFSVCPSYEDVNLMTAGTACLLLLSPHCLQQHLAHSRCSGNTCRMNNYKESLP